MVNTHGFFPTLSISPLSIVSKLRGDKRKKNISTSLGLNPSGDLFACNLRVYSPLGFKTPKRELYNWANPLHAMLWFVHDVEWRPFSGFL